MMTVSTLPATSRVWIYQSTRQFTDAESIEISQKINQFADQWVSHQNSLSAEGEILHNRFIVLTVDENHAKVSGCGIDSSVGFIKNLEIEYNTELFDRMNFAYRDGNEIKSANKDEFVELYNMGIINDETIIFNNLVDTRGSLENNWEIALKDSWHKNFL